MIILGLHSAIGWNGNHADDMSRVHDSGATLFVDGKHIRSIDESRLTRNKQEGNYPELSIRYCLEDLTPEDVDIVAYSPTAVHLCNTYTASRDIATFLKSRCVSLLKSVSLRFLFFMKYFANPAPDPTSIPTSCVLINLFIQSNLFFNKNFKLLDFLELKICVALSVSATLLILFSSGLNSTFFKILNILLNYFKFTNNSKSLHFLSVCKTKISFRFFCK